LAEVGWCAGIGAAAVAIAVMLGQIGCGANGAGSGPAAEVAGGGESGSSGTPAMAGEPSLAATGAREAAETARQRGALAFDEDTDKALAAYREAAALDPTDAWTWISIARLEARRGKLAAAEEAAVRARSAAETAGSERESMAATFELGDIRMALGDLAGASAAYEAAKLGAERRAGADPENAKWQRDLSVSLNKIGDVLVAQGDLAAALAIYG
jgi:tetratricopeptide (TPR) repeat protein